jgi:hypothetical protein
VTAHLLEAPIVEAVLADKDRLHGRLHVVVDAPDAGSLEQGEGPVVGIEHHLLRLPRIGPHEQHPAVAEPHVSHLHGHRHSAQQDDLVAPVELIGLPRRKAQRHIGCRRPMSALLGPAPDVAAHRIVATLIAAPAQFLEDPDQRQLLAGRLGRIIRQQPVELVRPAPQLGPGLDFTFVFKACLA